MKTTIALALAATLLGSAVTAEPGFGFQRTVEKGTLITLDLVRSDTGGRVDLTDINGRVMASQEVIAGANSNVRFQLDRNPTGNVYAVLYNANGEVVAERMLDRDIRD